MPFDGSRPELIIDLFAGGGGVSTGFEMALGRSPDYAVNHRAEALAMHRANHPKTRHVTEDVWHFNPRAVIGDWPVGILWASPDCKHFSRAKGATPVQRHIRDLAWVVVKLAREINPRIIMLENVPEFLDWGPLIEDDAGNCRPDPHAKGQTFREWAQALRDLGYVLEWRKLKVYQHAFRHGSPTLRTRLFVIARRDGRAIRWPEITRERYNHPDVISGKLLPARSAADIIDWDIPCPSIFETEAEIKAKYGIRVKRPIVPASMRRIAAGVWRWVLTDANPFILTLTHGRRLEPVTEPLRTITGAHRGERALVAATLSPQYGRSTGADARTPAGAITAGGGGKQALVAATMAQIGYGEREGQAPRAMDIRGPSGTVVSGGVKQAMIAAFLAQHNGGGYQGAGLPARDPVSTIAATGSQQGVVMAEMQACAGILSLHGADRRMSGPMDPVPSIAAGGGHVAEVRAFLTKYYSQGQTSQSVRDPLHSATAKARFGLVTVHGHDWQLVDIGMRMFTPRELYRAQGFPDDYIIDHGIDEEGRRIPLTKTLQVDFCGNAVPPEMAADIIWLNAPELARRAAA